MKKDFFLWFIKAPFVYLWDSWSRYLTILSTIAVVAGLLGLAVDNKSAYVSITSSAVLFLLIGNSFVKSTYNLYKANRDFEERLKPNIRLEAEPTKIRRTPLQEPIEQTVKVKVVNISPLTKIERCYGRIVEFDQILEDGRVLRNVGLWNSNVPKTQGAGLLEDSFSPVVVRWSATELDGQHSGIYYDFQSEASIDIAIIEDSNTSFLTLATANPQLRGQYAYEYNEQDEYYRLVLEVAGDNSVPVSQAFKLV
ncbi:MAG: hypothetical protein IIC84_09350, partial [Chloroflexi bacterium]|nr:hypothetical protein [Chloroflexota bacterium]